MTGVMQPKVQRQKLLQVPDITRACMLILIVCPFLSVLYSRVSQRSAMALDSSV